MGLRVKVRYECVVCGRKFPKGQGVTLVVGGKEFHFHSKSCAIKFIKRVIEEIDQGELLRAFERVEKEFREELELRAEKTAKKIA
ncbi:MAG: hypothetical protein J7L55_03545 [Desulfurococcales archaeon]|nr:hypothetical protein [Desulfurococcales archaeon]